MFPLLIASPLIGLVKSVASGAGGIASGVTKGLGKAISGTEKEAERRANADNEDVNPDINTKGAPVNFEEESPVSDMFGGLDLAKVKSTLDDEGPMGPPEPEAPTVYKRMIQVLKTMSETLLRMEATMKMLLAIEYERVKEMISQSAAENITLSQTEDGGGGTDDDDKKKKGLFGRGKDMLGSAWKKAKDSPTWLKMLGLVGLLGAIKLWKEDLEKAVAKILGWLTKTYEYFTAEDFSFAKIADDFKNKFMPKIYSVVDNILGSVWEYIKASIFGTKGDLRIQQEAGDAAITQKSLTGLSNKLTEGGADLSKVQFSASTGFLLGDSSLEKDEQKQLKSSLRDRINQMHEISKQSDGRIQWDTFPGYDFGNELWQATLTNVDDYFKLHRLDQFVYANPVIDGIKYDNWDILNGIELDVMAGITKGMSEDRAKKIRKVLEKKTNAYQSGEDVKSKLAVLHKEYLALEPELLPKLTTGDSIITNGAPSSGQKLKDAEKQTSVTGVNAPFINASTNDNSSTTNVTQNATVSLNGTNEYAIAAGLNEVTGTNYMFGYRTS